MHDRTHTRTDGDNCVGRNADNQLLTRLELAQRWKVSIEALKRTERSRIVRPKKLKGRIIRYRVTDVLRIEDEGYSAQGSSIVCEKLSRKRTPSEGQERANECKKENNQGKAE
jgi:hypothetical protein